MTLGKFPSIGTVDPKTHWVIVLSETPDEKSYHVWDPNGGHNRILAKRIFYQFHD